MNVGVLVSSLAASHMAFSLIRQGNRALRERAVDDLVAFYERPSRPCLEMVFAAMQENEAWSFDGVAIATSLATASRLSRCPRPSRRLFYVWDLEWLRLGAFDHAAVRSVYRDPSLRLVARGPDHVRLIENCWGVTAAVVPDFDFRQLLEVD